MRYLALFRCLSRFSGLVSLCLPIVVLLVVSSAAAVEPDNLKLRVDIDNVHMTINGDSITVDSHGNSLVKDAWFLLNLPPGEYEIVFEHAEYETRTRTITLEPGTIETIEVNFLPQKEPSGPQAGTVVIESDPAGATILVDGVSVDTVTPVELMLPLGERMIEVVEENFEPLSRPVSVDSMHKIIMRYVLRPLPPSDLTADSLGLFYDMELPMLEEERAELLRNQFNAFAETFAIIPFGQGLLAKILLSKDDQATANALVISGIVLSGGSYILGKILSARKLRFIRAQNEEIEAYNVRVKENNLEVDRAVQEANKEAYKKYLNDTKGKGRVKVIKE